MNKIIIANWKMSLSLKQSLNLLANYKQALKSKKTKNQIIVCPDFLSLAYLAAKKQDKRTFPFYLGSQTIGHLKYGALTGEISAFNLKKIGVNYSIIGHSERRQMGEDNDLILKKIKTALNAKLRPIVCFGEKNKMSKKKSQAFIEKQIKQCFSGLKKQEVEKIIIAYEPVWAIGSKNPCLAKDANLIHKEIKDMVLKNFSASVKVLYGGSVDDKNAKDYLAYENIDGLLVGGASLSIFQFKKIINY